VTGAGGFVGPWLAAHLREEGDEVTTIDAEVDVLDPAAVADALSKVTPDAVYHLAALSHVGDSWAAPGRVTAVNVVGTANVLAAAREVVPAATVLFVSSAEVYGAVSPARLPIVETEPTAPISPYAASKAAAEQIARAAWRAHGQRVLVVRPFNHIGPGQSADFAVSGLARRILAAKRSGTGELRVGTLSTERDFTDVRDVVRAYRRVVVEGEPGAVFNVCSGTAVALGDIVRRLFAIVGVELAVEPDPALVRPVDTPRIEGSASALTEATQWRPSYSLDQTLRDVVDYWLSADDPSSSAGLKRPLT
jgi:GDP-4-dehydro-6-deoxy-D-mannose reductase